MTREPDAMPTPDGAILLAYTRCNQPAREEEWSAWYDESHLPDMLAAGADVVSRFELTNKPVPGMPSIGFSHVALYEFRGAGAEERLEATLEQDAELRRLGKIHPSHCVISVDTLRAHRGRKVDPSPDVRGLIFVNVMCNDPSREAEWDAWYDEQHLPDIMATGAFAAGSRWLRCTPARFGPNHVTLYDITDCSVEHAIEISAEVMPKIAAAGRKHECHAGGMSVTLRPTGRHGGAGLWRRGAPAA